MIVTNAQNIAFGMILTFLTSPAAARSESGPMYAYVPAQIASITPFAPNGANGE